MKRRRSSVFLIGALFALWLGCVILLHLSFEWDSPTTIQQISNDYDYKSMSTTTSEKRKLYTPEVTYLSVPFYIYPDLVSMLDEATYSNISVHEAIRTHKVFGSLPKHDDDYHFAMSARNHPMRTNDPNKAQLFVVPIPFNMIVMATMYAKGNDKNNGSAGFCWKSRCNRQILEDIDELLNQSEWFQRHEGNDHVATLPFFHWDHHKINIVELKRLLTCHAVVFGDVPVPIDKNRLSLPTMYVGEGCDYAPVKKYDLVLIATIKTGIKFRPRRDICEWIANSNPPPWNVTMPICGAGQPHHCPALAEARWGFHVRGDSASSSRLFDTLLSGTVPIFTQDKQYWAVPDFYDWEKVSYFANVKNQTQFMTSMDHIVNDLQGYQARHANVLRNRNLFDWTTGTPFDIYMYRVQAHLWPETRSHNSRYNAIKI